MTGVWASDEPAHGGLEEELQLFPIRGARPPWSQWARHTPPIRCRATVDSRWRRPVHARGNPGDCHASYISIDDSLRRIANQALFDKLIVLPKDCIAGEPGEPFNAFFNPEVQTLAIRYQERTAESGPQTPSVARARRRTAAITHMTHQGSSDRTDITSPTNPKVDGTSISTPDASAHQPRA